MKLHFEPNLDYQLQAIEAVCDLFRGQEICRTEFTVTRDALGRTAAPGVCRERPRHRQPPARCSMTSCSANLNDIQLRNGLPPSGLARLRRLHRRDGDRHRQDLRLPAHDLRAEQALRLHQVRHRGAVGGDQGRRLQDAPDHRGALQGRSTPARPSTTSSTTRPSSARCATSPPARRSRSWW